MSTEPRTTAQIVFDLLEFAADHEWGDDIYCGGDYYEKGCRECNALRDNGEEHKPGCDRARLFEEARAFVRVETALAEERERVAGQ